MDHGLTSPHYHTLRLIKIVGHSYSTRVNY